MLNRVWALWNGGSSWSPSSIHDGDLEVFDSLDDAGEALISRAKLGHWQPQRFNYVQRGPQVALTPNADQGASMHVFLADPSDSRDPYPDYELTLNTDDEYTVTINPC